MELTFRAKIFSNLRRPAQEIPLSKIITGTLEVCLNSEPYLPSRVDSKCALKIRNAAERLNFIRENINVAQENFIKTKESGHEHDKENHDPGILRFKRLAKSPGSVVGRRRKGESEQSEQSEQSEESTDRREAVESRATRPLLFDQNIRRKDEESPSLDIDPSLFQPPKSLEVIVNLNFSSGPRVKHIDDAITRSVIKNVAQNN